MTGLILNNRNHPPTLRPAAQAPLADLARVRGVFADIDETISTRGKLTPEAYSALWRLHDAGVHLILVTGRAAGWCDHIARFWPVTAVVGENGGFYFHHDGARLHRRFLYHDAQRAEFRRRLDAIRLDIFHRFPGAALASDQLYREYDLAIDFCEDVPPLSRDDVLEIQAIFQRNGARAKISSIHVNGWFGEFDKLSTSRLCVRELFNEEIDPRDNASWLFCGDSPNDEPMFAYFQHSFGMANLRPYLDLIESPPAYITASPSGAGFIEVADLILQAKQAGDRPK